MVRKGVNSGKKPQESVYETFGFCIRGAPAKTPYRARRMFGNLVDRVPIPAAGRWTDPIQACPLAFVQRSRRKRGLRESCLVGWTAMSCVTGPGVSARSCASWLTEFRKSCSVPPDQATRVRSGPRHFLALGWRRSRFREGRLAGWHARCAHQRPCQSGPNRAANRSSRDPRSRFMGRGHRPSIASVCGDGHNPRSSVAWLLIISCFVAELPATKVTRGRCRLIHD